MNEIDIVIDTRLRFFFFGLEVFLDVDFDGHQMEKVFTDSEEDPKNIKNYAFYQSKKFSVLGHVADYEPESIFIQSNHSKLTTEKLEEIKKNTHIHNYRYKAFLESNEK